MKMIPFFFLLFIVLTFGEKDQIQDNILSGVLIDKSSKEPLAYVNIGIPETGIGTVSNGTGHYRFKIPEILRIMILSIFPSWATNLKKEL